MLVAHEAGTILQVHRGQDNYPVLRQNCGKVASQVVSCVLSSDWASFPRSQELTLSLRNKEPQKGGKDLRQSLNLSQRQPQGRGPGARGRAPASEDNTRESLASADSPRITRPALRWPGFPRVSKRQ